MKRRALKSGEAWAIDPRAIECADDSIFILFSPDAPQNEYANGIACVHVRGPLDHHEGYGDNYDAIRQRAKEAFDCDEAHTVIFRLDSPGGAVSGLIDTVRAIRGMAEASDKRSIAYVDERAFSAAYALACACEEIILPESGLTGSIGVISTMASQVEHDRMHGFEFVTLTSGARKSDGHIHVPISEEAKAVEQRRVDALAKQFFGLVAESRGLRMKDIAGFEAGLFLGQQAVRSGVADRVATFDQLLDELDDHMTHFGSITDGTLLPRGNAMTLRGELLAKLKEARRKLAAAKPAERAELKGQVAAYEASLEAYKKVTEKHVEHSKTHEEDDGDEDEEGNETDRGDDEEGDEKKKDEEASASARKVSAKGKSKARASEDEEEARAEDDEEEAMYDEEEEASGATGALSALVGNSPAARAELHALRANAQAGQQALAEVRKMRSTQERQGYLAAIESALQNKRLSPAEAKQLRAGKDVEGHTLPQADRKSYLRALLHGRKALVFGVEDDVVPSPLPNGHQAQLPEDLRKQLEQATTFGVDPAKVMKRFANAKVVERTPGMRSATADVNGFTGGKIGG